MDSKAQVLAPLKTQNFREVVWRKGSFSFFLKGVAKEGSVFTDLVSTRANGGKEVLFWGFGGLFWPFWLLRAIVFFSKGSNKNLKFCLGTGTTHFRQRNK